MKTIASLLIDHGAIEYGDFTLASGAKSTWYIDVKSAMTKPRLLTAIAREIVQRNRFDVVAGVAVGGVPLAVAAALAADKPFAIIRAAEKGHGKKGAVIGEVRGRDVLLVEDVTTSGGSALYGIKALRNAGGKADRVVTVVDREQGAGERLMAEGVQLVALVSVGELLKKTNTS